MNEFLAAFTPNKAVSKSTIKLLLGIEALFLLVLWIYSPFTFLPSLGEVWQAFMIQWNDGLFAQLFTSVMANLQAIGLSCIVSLGLAYLTVLEGFRPVVTFLSKFRFLSLVGISFYFQLLSRSDHELKMILLVFSISVFFVTGMADVIESIPKEQYDLARTLRMGPWRVVWEVVVLGQFDKAFDVLRQNAAIGWMMLTMVESMVRSQGGIGAMLATEQKHFHLNAMIAIQVTIFIVGLGQDYMIGGIKNLVCPYASLGSERK
jgi:NitT/TauT family transport system permease protein